MQHTKEEVRVGPSAHGLGLYAARRFEVGEYVGPIEGQVVDDPDYGSDYGIDVGGDGTLEPAAPFRYLNHSCEPNCELTVFDEEAEDGTACGSSVWLAIVRQIAPGEQMTIDYAWPVDGAIRCGCGAAGCRGWIVSAEGLEEMLLDREIALTAD